jgi:hypothetical protein
VKEVQGKDTAENGSTYRLNGDKSSYSTHCRYTYWCAHLFYITPLLTYILGLFNTFGFFLSVIFEIVLLYSSIYRIKQSIKNNHLRVKAEYVIDESGTWFATCDKVYKGVTFYNEGDPVPYEVVSCRATLTFYVP